MTKILHIAGMGFCVVLLLASGAAGETRNLQDFLPSGELLESWRPVDGPLRYGAATLYNFIDGAAEIVLEYGFVQVVSQEYAQGYDSVVCTIYEMKDPKAAYGIFSYHRTPQKQTVAIGDGGFQGGFQLAFWQERYCVIVESYSAGEEMERVVVVFAERISEKIGAHAEEPAVVRRLPGGDLIDGSQKLLGGHLALGGLLFIGTPDLFELGEEDQALYGEYGSSEEKAKLFLVVYGEAEKASRIYSQIRRLFDSGEEFRPLNEPGPSLFWTRQGRYFALGLRANTLALVTEAASLDKAEDIVNRCWNPNRR